MKLRFLLLVLIIFCSTLLPGCWDYEEYEDLIQVSAIGIDFDKESGETTFTVQYIPTTKGVGGGQSSGSSPQKPAVVHSATDKSIYDALSKLQQVIYKKLFYGYLKVLVIGEDAAKHNLVDIIELHDRTPVIRPTSFIIITSGKAEDVISTFDASMIASSSEEIFNLINIGGNVGAAYPVTVQRFTETLAVPGIEATAPRVITVSKKPRPDPKGGTEGNIRHDEEREGDHRVAGIAAFKRDKFIGWLNEQESLGFGWITGKKILAYKVSEKEGKSDKVDTENIIFYRTVRSKGEIKVQTKHGKPVFQVNVKIVADLRKYYSRSGSEFLTPKVISLMEKKLSESIRADIRAALNKGQRQFKSDIFGFGFALYREDTELWRREYEKKWDKIFPALPITINVKAKIINTGTNNRNFVLK